MMTMAELMAKQLLVYRAVAVRPDGAQVNTHYDGEVTIHRSDVSFLLRPDGRKAWLTERGITMVDRTGHREYYPQRCQVVD